MTKIFFKKTLYRPNQAFSQATFDQRTSSWSQIQEKCPVSLLEPSEDRVGMWHVAAHSEQTPLRTRPTA